MAMASIKWSWRRAAGALAALMGLAAFTGLGWAQADEDSAWTKRVPAQQDEAALPLYAGAAPGSETATVTEVWSDIGTERWVRNVTKPTLLPVLPDPEIANGAAVLVVPGGGFQFVSIDNEGYRIADRLAAQGIAAFLLKYRVMETPDAESAFSTYIAQVFAGEAPVEGFDSRDGIPFAVADAQAAFKLIESRADEWGVDTDRLGMLGFSAGAVTTLSVTLAEAGAPQPDFIGYIYGPMNLPFIPAKPPPMFTALAADDGLFGKQGFSLVEDWQAAGGAVELHFYERGGHGFGGYQRGVTADAWFEQFVAWMKMRGLLKSESALKDNAN